MPSGMDEHTCISFKHDGDCVVEVVADAVGTRIHYIIMIEEDNIVELVCM